MPVYEYRCPRCGTRVTSLSRDNFLAQTCLGCGYTEGLKRVFSFAFKPLMHEHFNHTVNQPISDMRQFRAALSEKSERATEETGIPHNFQPVEWGDRVKLGVTNEGIPESNVVRRAKGMRELPMVPDN